MNRKVHIALIVCISLLLLAPMLQNFVLKIKHPQPRGYYQKVEAPKLSTESFFNESFQKGLNAYAKQNFGFRNYYIRTSNELAYRAFNLAKANGVFIGKDNYLYAGGYIDVYLGKDNKPEAHIVAVVDSLKEIRAYLNERGKELLFIQAPGKGHFYPENLPNKFKVERSLPNNYHMFRGALDSSGIPYFDTQAWFIQAKDTAEHLWYPQTGIHWSNYAQHLVFDSLARMLEDIYDHGFAEMQITGINKTKNAKFADSDIEDAMNLLFDIDNKELTYPQTKYKEGVKVSAAVIADSFFWGPWGEGIAQNYFEPLQFWYYHKEFRTYGNPKMRKREEFDLAAEIEDLDLLIILATDAQLYRVPWGFSKDFFETLMAKVEN